MFWPGGMGGGVVAKMGISATKPQKPPVQMGVIGIALLELDPHLGADGRNHETAGLDARRRNAGHGPTRWDHAKDIRNLHEDAADLFRVDVLDDQASVFPVEPF